MAEAQPSDDYNQDKGNFKLNAVFKRTADSLEREFRSKGLDWPAKYLFIRAFKLERQLEVWVKSDPVEPFRLFKMYKVCATSGTFGPKRKEGDRQIPEGFYYINEFNPNSNYYLSLGINYPNASDLLKSDINNPGSDIFIHGSCVTIGCLPMTDPVMDELFFLTTTAKKEGQDFIPVHLYPYRFDDSSSAGQYKQKTVSKPELRSFNKPLEQAYTYFEETYHLPAILISENGDYRIATNPDVPKNPPKKVVRKSTDHDTYAEWSPEENVDLLPTYKSGTAALQKWLFQLSKDLSIHLPANTSMTLQVQFLVDQEGLTRLPKVTRGGTYKMNQIIQERFKNELRWNPALKAGIPVATKMIQNINLVAPEDLD